MQLVKRHSEKVVGRTWIDDVGEVPDFLYSVRVECRLFKARIRPTLAVSQTTSKSYNDPF